MNKKERAEYNIKWKSTVKGRFATLKHAAKQDKREVTLSFEEFAFLFNQLCFYCNGPINTTKHGYSLDRLDSNLGYTMENSVPCCISCNKRKGTRSPEDAIIYIRKAIS